ncbi:tetratricopeptide repeat protein [Tateyamaria sp.]|uniref:tetratricopeptide repeat protein n=1 Tax=Tateyamaria sp. TaxID=1929288 RepID=UPI003B228E14
MPADTVTPMEGSNLRITSSADIAINERGSSVATSLGISCADPKTMNVNDWGSDQPFSSQISGYRNLLFSEFDRLNTDAAVKLARAYLYFGFGAEARQILSMDAQLARDNPALIEIAEIMEYGSANNARYLPNFTECDTTVALWAILAEPSIDTAKQINIKAALRTVTALPMHLRRFIAPELSRRLLDYGDPDAAAAALRSVERTAEPMSPNANLARANLDLAQGKVAEGQERLAKVVSSNVEQSAAALIQFIDSHLDADAEIDQSVATLVEGYALQMRDEPIGAELRRAHVLALGKSGQFDAAFDALDRVRERDAASMDLTLKSSILTLLTQNGEDIEFLDHVFEQMTYSLGSVKPRAKVKIARRLVDLGFAREAETVLGAREDIPNKAAIKILRGQIALELGRPFEAEALAYGIDTPEADMLRARAKRQAGAYEAAHTILEDLGEQDASAHSAWLANSWTALVREDAAVFGQIARVAQTELSENTELQGMLSRTSEAISESAAARATIRDLLRTTTSTAGQSPAN